jgi:hypothetical protein
MLSDAQIQNLKSKSINFRKWLPLSGATPVT